MRLILPVIVLTLMACERAEQAPVPVNSPANFPEASSADGPGASGTQEQPQAVLPTPPPTWRALGTEPFWSLDLAGSNALYRTPDDQAGQRFAVVREVRGDGGERASGVLQDEPLELAIAAGKCSDGMSDRSYEWQAALTIGSTRFAGCAYRGELPPSDRP